MSHQRAEGCCFALAATRAPSPVNEIDVTAPSSPASARASPPHDHRFTPPSSPPVTT